MGSASWTCSKSRSLRAEEADGALFGRLMIRLLGATFVRASATQGLESTRRTRGSQSKASHMAKGLESQDRPFRELDNEMHAPSTVGSQLALLENLEEGP